MSLAASLMTVYNQDTTGFEPVTFGSGGSPRARGPWRGLTAQPPTPKRVAAVRNSSPACSRLPIPVLRNSVPFSSDSVPPCRPPPSARSTNAASVSENPVPWHGMTHRSQRRLPRRTQCKLHYRVSSGLQFFHCAASVRGDPFGLVLDVRRASSRLRSHL